MGSAALAEAAKSIRDWSLADRTSSAPAVRGADVFGSLVFTDKLQKERLPKAAYHALRATIQHPEAAQAIRVEQRAHRVVRLPHQPKASVGVELAGRPIALKGPHLQARKGALGDLQERRA